MKNQNGDRNPNKSIMILNINGLKLQLKGRDC